MKFSALRPVAWKRQVPYWADVAKDRSGSAAEIRFSERLVFIDKVLVSRSLETVDSKTTIIRNDPAAELWKLKEQPGKTIFGWHHKHVAGTDCGGLGR